MFPRLEDLITTLDDEQLAELQHVIEIAWTELKRYEPTRAIVESDLRYPDRPPINIAVNPHGAELAGCLDLLDLIELRRKDLRGG